MPQIYRDLTHFGLMLWLALCSTLAHAYGEVTAVPTRPDVTTPVFWEAHEGAKATLLLFPGGAGDFGKVENGRPTGSNFLVRSTPLFLASGFNVAIIGRPSDMPDLDYTRRMSAAHLTDIRAVLEFVKKQSSAPVWLVGTSRGTVSATAATIGLPDAGIAGLVLTSSVVNYKKTGAIPTQELAAIKVPVLILHHAKDACAQCKPYEVPAIERGLKNAPIKKTIMVDGGANPTGDPCEALHWHGFIGMEQEAVDIIANWIKQPSP
jgi:pimeloyl-ACP methyl ester carboxylesterase